MKLSDIVKHVSSMTEEELHEHVRSIRHNREVARLGKQAHTKRAAAKTSRKTAADINSKLESMSPEDRQALLELLEEQAASF